MVIKNGNVFHEDGSFETRDVFVNNDIFTAENNLDGRVIDAQDLYVIPGLTDVHFHGCAGYDFCDGTVEAIEAMAVYEAQNGVTTINPATMTLAEDRLDSICRAAAAYEPKKGAILTGINMEGPFINLSKKGAQNPLYIKKPDVEMYRRLQTASNNMITLVALAPEEEGSMEFINAVKNEVSVSIAHTTADYDIAAEAFENGARQVTHLYNAMPPFTHRAPGVIGAAFDCKCAYVELICDGIHIHPSVVRATLQLFGEDRVVFISDSMMATGMVDGDYALGGQPVKVVGNRATLTDGTIAGSATNLMDCMKTAVKTMGVPLGTAVRCAAANSAKSVGIFDKYGSITNGKVANFVLMDKDLNIHSVYINGQREF